MPTVRPVLRTTALLVLSVLVVTATTGALLSTPGREPTGLQLILSPHPDDELLVWPAIEDDPASYTVVVTLSRGEATGFCDQVQARTQTRAGEVLPEPQPAAGDTAACGRARVEAWSSFLTQAAEHTEEIRRGTTERARRPDPRWGGQADFWVGDDAAHVVLSLPDGALDQNRVVAAVEALLESRGETLPDLPLRRILSAGYWNDSAERGSRTEASGDCAAAQDCPGTPAVFEYEHPDHRALSLAMPALAPLTEAGAWVSVPTGGVSSLRRALGSNTGRLQTMTLAPPDYEVLMGLGPEGEQGPERLGLQQQLYGWLAFPGQWWPVGEVVDRQVLFAREQTYLVIPGGAR
ncbi:MAG: hypothetical protein ACR2FV_04600 [Ornithinimicrobium sp.]|uniref:hypothetical protein n=1 Tax=Ornithinimicrobium sp. TaxID=1977084 RepID=UPI003D9ACB87